MTAQFPDFRLTVQRLMADYQQRIGARIVESRNAKGWNQRALAFHADISEKQLGRIERGESNPRPNTLTKIAEAVGKEVADLRPDPVAEERELQDHLDRIEEKLDRLLAERSLKNGRP